MNYRGVEEKHENLNIQDLWKILVKQQEQIDTLLASYIEPIPFNVVDDNDMASPSFPDLLEPLPVNEDLIDNFDVTKVFE